MPADSEEDWTDRVAALYPDYTADQQAALIKLAQATEAVYRADEQAAAARAEESVIRTQTDEILSNDDQVGDPACWLAWTCPDCGAFVGGEPPENCPRCGGRLL